jgi:hypothetical protein
LHRATLASAAGGAQQPSDDAASPRRVAKCSGTRHIVGMATLVIPDALKRKIELQAQSVGAATPADYIAELIDIDAREHEAIIAALEIGEASGVSDETPESILEAFIRSRLAA